MKEDIRDCTELHDEMIYLPFTMQYKKIESTMQCTEMIQVSRKTVNQALGRVLGCILDEYEWYFIDIDERYCNADRICMFWAA